LCRAVEIRRDQPGKRVDAKRKQRRAEWGARPHQHRKGRRWCEGKQARNAAVGKSRCGDREIFCRRDEIDSSFRWIFAGAGLAFDHRGTGEFLIKLGKTPNDYRTFDTWLDHVETVRGHTLEIIAVVMGVCRGIAQYALEDIIRFHKCGQIGQPAALIFAGVRQTVTASGAAHRCMHQAGTHRSLDIGPVETNDDTLGDAGNIVTENGLKPFFHKGSKGGKQNAVIQKARMKARIAGFKKTFLFRFPATRYFEVETLDDFVAWLIEAYTQKVVLNQPSESSI